MNKQYRLYKYILAKNKYEANKVAKDFLSDKLMLDNFFGVEEWPFNPSEEVVLLELARIALADAENYDKMADEFDLSDEVLKKLQNKLVNYMNNK